MWRIHRMLSSMQAGLRALLIMAMAMPILRAETTAEDIPTYKLGMDAMSGRLWEVAAARFQSALETEDLDESVTQEILLRLAESRIRGKRGNLALETLARPELAEHPDLKFWRAQAMAADGQFRDAIAIFEDLPSDSSYYLEAQMTCAKLQRAIGDYDGALVTLDKISEKDDAPASANILKAEILLDQKKTEEALAVLPDTEALTASEAKSVKHLRARGLLAMSDAEGAVPILDELTQSPEGQSKRQYHRGIINLARARINLKQVEAAADGLLAFIQKNPDSPLLGRAFDLLVECLPPQPAPNDPILTRIREWMPARPLPGTTLTPGGSDVEGAWPTMLAKQNNLAPQAIYHLALGTKKQATPDARERAMQLLTRLRLDYPSHPLVARALLTSGQWALESNETEAASAYFQALQQLDSSPPELRAEALTLEASSLLQQKRYEEAKQLFDRASDLLEADRRRSARLNAATSLLAAGDIPAFDQLRDSNDDPTLQVQLELERALYLASRRDPNAFPTLEAFLADHPNHPRKNEALVSAALAALDARPPSTDKARKYLDAIPEEALAKLPAVSIALAEIRLHQQLKEWDKAAELAADFIAKHPNDPAIPSIRFEQGRALFSNRDYNDAELVLKQLVKEAPDSPQAAAALLLSARAAAEGATPQSQNESLRLFDELIQSESPFQAVARLEKADILIRMSRLDEAIEELSPWFESMEDSDPLLLSAGLLLGDALFANAEGNSEKLALALEVYERLLGVLPEDSPVRARILYQKGLAMEEIQGSEDDALIVYMDVLQQASNSLRNDWKSIELCGFRAMQILEKREDWPAAIRLARRISDLKGPSTEKFAERAKQLRQEHFIWDENANEAPSEENKEEQ